MPVTKKPVRVKKGQKMYEMNTDIMRIGGTYYAVKRIESQNIDINEELKSLYTQRHARHVENLNTGIVENAQEDWDKQIEHLRSFEGRGAITIPSRLFSKPVMEHRGNLLELRMIVYSPNEVQGTRDSFRGVVDGDLAQGTLYASVKPLFNIPMLVGYCPRTKHLWTPTQQTFHSFGDGRVCTGTHSGEDFWNLNDKDLTTEMNRINLFSPANRHIDVDGTSYDMRNAYSRENIISITERRDTIWSV